MKQEKKRVGCVVMAAGNASRFGENKLSVMIEGRSLMERTLDAVPRESFEAVVVVTQYDRIEALALERGFSCVRNDAPELGLSHTIHLGLRALEDMDGVLFLVSDQPYLKRETVQREVCEFLQNSEKIVALSHNGQRGNPCIFPKEFFPELLAISGDRGGSAVIRRHEDCLLLVEADEAELRDVDTKEDLALSNK